MLHGLATEVMVAYAYDAIARRHPLHFLGMVFVLEGTSVSLALAAAGFARWGALRPRAARAGSGSRDVRRRRTVRAVNLAQSAKAVFFDVDFTLIYPGPTFHGEGYEVFCARHGIVIDPSRFAHAVASAAPVLESPDDSVYDAELFVTYQNGGFNLVGTATYTKAKRAA